jgi:hypothetical protein
MKALKERGELAAHRRALEYELWSAYASWSQRFARVEQEKLDGLLVSLANELN